MYEYVVVLFVSGDLWIEVEGVGRVECIVVVGLVFDLVVECVMLW